MRKAHLYIIEISLFFAIFSCLYKIDLIKQLNDAIFVSAISVHVIGVAYLFYINLKKFKK